MEPGLYTVPVRSPYILHKDAFGLSLTQPIQGDKICSVTLGCLATFTHLPEIYQWAGSLYSAVQPIPDIQYPFIEFFPWPQMTVKQYPMSHMRSSYCVRSTQMQNLGFKWYNPLNWWLCRELYFQQYFHPYQYLSLKHRITHGIYLKTVTNRWNYAWLTCL